MVNRACEMLLISDYHLWGLVDENVLNDPQWWDDVYMWFTLRAAQQRPEVPEWAENAANSNVS